MLPAPHTIDRSAPNHEVFAQSPSGKLHTGPIILRIIRPIQGTAVKLSYPPQRDKLTKDFEFVDQGHTFFCSVERPRHAGMDAWWFFRIDSEQNTRYAPFPALPDDTQKSVQRRVVAYYAELLAIKARPVHQRPKWNSPGGFRGPAKPAEPAPVEEAK